MHEQAASVYLEAGDDKFAALSRAVQASNFMDRVAAVHEQSGKPRLSQGSGKWLSLLADGAVSSRLRLDRAACY